MSMWDELDRAKLALQFLRRACGPLEVRENEDGRWDIVLRIDGGYRGEGEDGWGVTKEGMLGKYADDIWPILYGFDNSGKGADRDLLRNLEQIRMRRHPGLLPVVYSDNSSWIPIPLSEES
jgi:hypothetical protein